MADNSVQSGIDGFLTAEPFIAYPNSVRLNRWMILKAHAKHAGKEVVADNVNGEGAARRLAACWNACDGFEIEVLEKANFMESGYAAEGREFELTKQRDALLAALDTIVTAADGVICQGGVLCIDDKSSGWLDEARALVAAAKAGTQ